MFKKVFTYAADRLAERSTRIAISVLLGMFGVVVDPTQIEAIAMVVGSLSAAVEALVPDDAVLRRQHKQMLASVDPELLKSGSGSFAPRQAPVTFTPYNIN